MQRTGALIASRRVPLVGIAEWGATVQQAGAAPLFRQASSSNRGADGLRVRMRRYPSFARG